MQMPDITRLGCQILRILPKIQLNLVKNLNQNQKKVLSEYANQILNIRKELNLSLEKLYDSIFMPRELKEVHQKLDKSVKEIYLIDEDSNSSQIMSKLFNLIKKNPQNFHPRSLEF